MRRVDAQEGTCQSSGWESRAMTYGASGRVRRYVAKSLELPPDLP